MVTAELSDKKEHPCNLARKCHPGRTELQGPRSRGGKQPGTRLHKKKTSVAGMYQSQGRGEKMRSEEEEADDTGPCHQGKELELTPCTVRTPLKGYKRWVA